MPTEDPDLVKARIWWTLHPAVVLLFNACNLVLILTGINYWSDSDSQSFVLVPLGLTVAVFPWMVYWEYINYLRALADREEGK